MKEYFLVFTIIEDSLGKDYDHELFPNEDDAKTYQQAIEKKFDAFYYLVESYIEKITVTKDVKTLIRNWVDEENEEDWLNDCPNPLLLRGFIWLFNVIKSYKGDY